MTEKSSFTEEGKCCTKCGVFKAYDQFNKKSKGPDGRQSECRECNKKRHAAYRKANPEKIRKASKKFKDGNKEKLAAQHREWASRNKEKLRNVARAYRQRNGDKLRANEKERYRKNRKKRLESLLISKYGITQLEFDGLLQRQGNSCAICGSSDPRGRGGFHVDHDHETGEVRGLLCHNCNTGLGKLGDNLESLERAVQYLLNSPKRIASDLASMRE
jgi:hypothetical protein